jgi:glycyl-tRNA synthetase beta chain
MDKKDLPLEKKTEVLPHPEQQKQQDLLLEIGCEELPPHAVKILAENLKENLYAQLESQRLSVERENIHAFSTPRRLAVWVEKIDTQLSSQTIERTGPNWDKAFDAKGKPTPAALGFAKSCGVDITVLTQKDGRLYFKGEKPSQQTMDVLPELVRQAIHSLPIAKPMRWGTHTESFARPVHWIVLLFGDQIIHTKLFDQPTGRLTYGHRFHHPDALTINSPGDYAVILQEQGKVIANFSARLQKIKQAITDVTPNGQTVNIEEDLLNEVTSLVEWPVALVGQFNPEFLTVPQEALITSMQVNQKYFPVLDQQGKLQPQLILISNIEGKNPDLIVHGNERVLNARLADAMFFFKNDCAHSLQSRLPHLEHVTFQKQLGSLAHKTERMVKLAADIITELGEDAHIAGQAAQLSKCDLLTEMVGEFPTLQGVMGYYYAKNDGLSEQCALAIKEHYYPRFANDKLPSNHTGCAVALADKLDTLIGIFGINQAPTGDKDPFALRRAANGILAILIGKELPLDLIKLLEQAKQAYSIHLPNLAVVEQAFEFAMSRFKSICLEKGFTYEEFESVAACKPTQPLDFISRLQAVKEFQKLPEASALAAANKRVSNILKKQATITLPEKIDANLFEYEAERVLADKLNAQDKIVRQLYARADYTNALSQLAALKEPVDTFFDKVMVMTEDTAKRNNRLALLAALHRLFTQIADIAYL